jgi:hypothetical protein
MQSSHPRVFCSPLTFRGGGQGWVFRHPDQAPGYGRRNKTEKKEKKTPSQHQAELELGDIAKVPLTPAKNREAKQKVNSDEAENGGEPISQYFLPSFSVGNVWSGAEM